MRRNEQQNGVVNRQQVMLRLKIAPISPQKLLRIRKLAIKVVNRLLQPLVKLVKTADVAPLVQMLQ